MPTSLPSVGITQGARAGVLVAVAQVPPWDMAIQATQWYYMCAWFISCVNYLFISVFMLSLYVYFDL
jgi:hypothetical protein